MNHHQCAPCGVRGRYTRAGIGAVSRGRDGLVRIGLVAVVLVAAWLVGAGLATAENEAGGAAGAGSSVQATSEAAGAVSLQELLRSPGIFSL